jgi:tRNA1(Val) A37 N6-methylase TrmN6
LRYSVSEIVHEAIKPHVTEGGLCIDATAGNGNDTLYLAKLVGVEGQVIAFDIQEDAVANTEKRLQEQDMSERAKVVLDSHVNMASYAKENTVDCIVFNLGYLPGGDHKMATQANSSIEAMNVALKLLKKKGLLSVTIYSGGDSGFEEKDAVLSWLRQLDQRKYLVLVTEYYNRQNNPPIPVRIIKL